MFQSKIQLHIKIQQKFTLLFYYQSFLLSFYKIINIFRLKKMLPSMRYESKKLTQLYHMKKSFKDHRQSISKMKNQKPKGATDRINELNQIKNRKHSSFNHTQYVRAKDIHKDNMRLYKQCFDGRNKLEKNEFKNPEKIRQKQKGNITQSKFDNSSMRQSQTIRRQILLKNHRKQSIGKLTGYERTRQNFRLALKIAQPCPSINTKKLQKIHQQAKRRKERIMRYDSTSLKSQKYLQKRFSSVSSIRSNKSVSPPKSVRNLYADKNSIFKRNSALTSYINRNNASEERSSFLTNRENNKKLIFRGKFNQSNTFSLTQYNNGQVNAQKSQ